MICNFNSNSELFDIHLKMHLRKKLKKCSQDINYAMSKVEHDLMGLKYSKGKRTTYFSILFKPFFKFISRYFFKLGILDGKQGLIIALLTAYNVFLTNIKMYRLANGEKLA